MDIPRLCYMSGMRRIVPILFFVVAATGCTRSESTKLASTPTSTSAPTSAPTVAAALAAPKVPTAWADVADQLPETWVASLAFAETMVAEHGATIDQITCHCCKQTLGACFRGTIARAANSCPPL